MRGKDFLLRKVKVRQKYTPCRAHLQHLSCTKSFWNRSTARGNSNNFTHMVSIFLCSMSSLYQNLSWVLPLDCLHLNRNKNLKEKEENPDLRIPTTLLCGQDLTAEESC